jgi:hypothetical protein
MVGGSVMQAQWTYKDLAGHLAADGADRDMEVRGPFKSLGLMF